jgi:hypothetical protein
MTSCDIRVETWTYLKVKYISPITIKAKKTVYEFPSLLGGLKEEKYLINNKNLHK